LIVQIGPAVSEEIVVKQTHTHTHTDTRFYVI
jgi:hypothetical protein